MAPQKPNSRLEYTLGFLNDYDNQYPPISAQSKIVHPAVPIWPLSPEELDKHVRRVSYCDAYKYRYNIEFPPIPGGNVVIWPPPPVWPVWPL